MPAPEKSESCHGSVAGPRRSDEEDERVAGDEVGEDPEEDEREDEEDEEDEEGVIGEKAPELVPEPEPAPAAHVVGPSIVAGCGDGVMVEEALADQEAPASRTASRASSSSRARPLVIVPRAQRRGLFGRLTIVPEVERPYDYRNRTKWGITLVIALAAAAAPMGSSIFYRASSPPLQTPGEGAVLSLLLLLLLPLLLLSRRALVPPSSGADPLPTGPHAASLGLLVKDLHTTPTIANLSVAFYMLAMAIFPLFWSSFSEQFGRRSIYIVSFALFVIFAVLCALSRNISMLIVFRLCSGGASASVQAVGAGTIADIWKPYERGRAMGFFYLGPLLGPLIAPVFGGALAERLGWQATMWFLAIFGVCTEVMLLFFLPETLSRSGDHRPHHHNHEPPTAAAAGPPRPSLELRRMATRESVASHARGVAGAFKRFFLDPLKVVYLLRFPAVLITVVIAAQAFGALFFMNIALQQKFMEPPYRFDQIIVGLMYCAPGLGYFLVSMFGGRWIDRIMAREARKANRYDDRGRLVYRPEDRMRENMWIAHTAYPLSLLAFGWTLRYGVYFIVPEICLFFFGISTMLVFVRINPSKPPNSAACFLSLGHCPPSPLLLLLLCDSLHGPGHCDARLADPTPGFGGAFGGAAVCRHDDAHRVRPQEELLRRGGEQPAAQHLFLRSRHRRFVLDRRHQRRLGLHLHLHLVHGRWLPWDLDAETQRGEVEEANGGGNGEHLIGKHIKTRPLESRGNVCTHWILCETEWEILIFRRFLSYGIRCLLGLALAPHFLSGTNMAKRLCIHVIKLYCLCILKCFSFAFSRLIRLHLQDGHAESTSVLCFFSCALGGDPASSCAMSLHLVRILDCSF